MADSIGFEIKVVKGNILKIKADVLALKYSQSWSLLGQNVIRNLPDDSILIERPPRPGDWLMVPSEGSVTARHILLIGTPSRKMYSYDSMRQLAYTALQALSEADTDPPIKHLAITVHGVGWGFDEAESLKAMVLGFRSAVDEGKYPKQLQRISIVETRAQRAEVLEKALAELLGGTPPPPAETPARAATKTQPLVITPDSSPTVTETPSLEEPSIFVAMPFAPKYKDAFYYVIQPCVKEIGFQCIRLDETSYTGDIVETIKSRIRNAKLMIALLDGANPNVYLEVGYAWGVGTPTVLIINQEQENDVPFDVKTQKRMVYESLYELKPRLTDELKAIIGGLKSPAKRKSKTT